MELPVKPAGPATLAAFDYNLEVGIPNLQGEINKNTHLKILSQDQGFSTLKDLTYQHGYSQKIYGPTSMPFNHNLNFQHDLLCKVVWFKQQLWSWSRRIVPY